jgi:hypothetical protein
MNKRSYNTLSSMRKMKKLGLFCLLFTLAATPVTKAGNPDRSGQAGGTQLLINPYARNSGWGGANMAGASGLESQYLNVAGLAHIPKTELIFARTNWLAGSNININAFGFTQKVGESGALALGIVSTNMGMIDITTVESPEGGLGTFNPQFLNLNMSYAKEFSNSIFGGVNVKVLSESIADLRAQGICFDAGIQYHTSTGSNKEKGRKNVKFGISLKNVGPQMSYSGDGLSVKANLLSTGSALTLEQRSFNFDLPSLVNIGASYDYYLSPENDDHIITAAGMFTSNSFTRDQFSLGAQYGFKQMFMVRAGFVYEDGIFNQNDRLTALTGPCAGVTCELPVVKREKDKGGNTTFALDYSYRATQPFGGSHTMGVRIKL